MVARGYSATTCSALSYPASRLAGDPDARLGHVHHYKLGLTLDLDIS
jgi:hypothetical protein